MLFRSSIFGSVLLLALAACTPTPPPTQPPVPAQGQNVIKGDAAPPAVTQANPMLTSAGVIRVTMYQLQMPYGANSRDDSFWKLVDEDVVDVATNINMHNNGLRVGPARMADWPDFLSFSSANPRSSCAKPSTRPSLPLRMLRSRCPTSFPRSCCSSTTITA